MDIGVTGSGDDLAGRIEQIEPVKVEPEGCLEEDQRGENAEVDAYLLCYKQLEAAHMDAALDCIGDNADDEGHEKEKTKEGTQRLV